MTNKIARYTMTLKDREGPVIAVDQNGNEIEAESFGWPAIELCRSWEVRRLEQANAEMRKYLISQEAEASHDLVIKSIAAAVLIVGLVGLTAVDMGWF